MPTLTASIWYLRGSAQLAELLGAEVLCPRIAAIAEAYAHADRLFHRSEIDGGLNFTESAKSRASSCERGTGAADGRPSVLQRRSTLVVARDETTMATERKVEGRLW